MEQKYIIDNLKKFGLDFQIKCISSLVSDRTFLERIHDIIDVDTFETDAHQWIVKEIISYFNQYKDLPTLNVFKVRVETINNKVLSQSVVDNLKLIYQKMNDNDINFIKEQFLEFCKNQKLKNAIFESADLLNTGQYEKIKHVVDQAMKAGMERNIGHEYESDVEKRMSVMSRNCIKTNWQEIDSIMDGGLGPGELGIITACAGSGKSWVLSKLGAEAMKQGKNVVHFTLELNENYVGLRYDSCFTGIDFQNIRNNVDVVRQKIAEVPGKLVIKYFPIKTVSAHSLKAHVERLAVLGTKVDMIIVDYADLLKPKKSYTEKRHDLESIYEDLRGLAKEFECPVWTCSQTNRTGYNAELVSAESISEAFSKCFVADFIFTLSRTAEDKNDNAGRFFVAKNRFGPDGLVYPIDMDTSKVYIKVHKKTSIEEVKNKKDHAKDQKQYLRERYEKLMKKKEEDEGEE